MADDVRSAADDQAVRRHTRVWLICQWASGPLFLAMVSNSPAKWALVPCAGFVLVQLLAVRQQSCLALLRPQSSVRGFSLVRRQREQAVHAGWSPFLTLVLTLGSIALLLAGMVLSIHGLFR